MSDSTVYDVVCVAPCKNEQDNIEELVRRIDAVGLGNVAIVLVDDGSTDETWAVMRDIALTREGTICVRLSQCGFGQELAIRCGLQHAIDLNTQYIAIMDADLQDPPELLSEMFEQVSSGACSQVIATRTGRGSEGLVKRIGSTVYYKIISNALGCSAKDIRNLRLMTHSAAVATLSHMSNVTSSKYESLRAWGDFREIEYAYVERDAGKSKYDIVKLSRYACDGIISANKGLEFIPVLCGIITGFVCVVCAIAAIVCENMFFGIAAVVLGCLIPVHIGIAVVGLFARMAYEESRGRMYVEREIVSS